MVTSVKLLWHSKSRWWLFQGIPYVHTPSSHSGWLGQWALAKGQWQCFLAGKVATGLMSHWPCVTGRLVFPRSTYRLIGLRKAPDTFIPDIVSGKHGYKNTDWICRCCPKGSKSTTKSSSSPHSEKFESSSEDEGVRDDMLYIAVDSDDEIRVRGVHSDSSSASESSDDSSSSSTANEAQSPREMCEVQDDEKLAWTVLSLWHSVVLYVYDLTL